MAFVDKSYFEDNSLLFHCELQLNTITVQQLNILSRKCLLLRKINALKQYYVRKQELVYFRA